MAIHWHGLVFELTITSLWLLYEYCKMKKKKKNSKQKDKKSNSEMKICSICGKNLTDKSTNYELDCGHISHKECYQSQSKKECNVCKIESIKDFEKIEFHPEDVEKK